MGTVGSELRCAALAAAWSQILIIQAELGVAKFTATMAAAARPAAAADPGADPGADRPPAA